MHRHFNEGGLSYTIRRLTKEQYAAEVAAEQSDETGEAPITPTTTVGNASRKPQDSVSTASTSDRLAEAIKRVANKQSAPAEIQVTERKVNQPAPETAETPNATSDALTAAIRKARGIA